VPQAHEPMLAGADAQPAAEQPRFGDGSDAGREALAASIGAKKYGKARMQAMASASRSK
jgi:hypothetical protein